MGHNLNPMAKPFHIGSSMPSRSGPDGLNVEFILSLPKECSTFTFSPPLSSALCFLSSAPHKYEVIVQNKPNPLDTKMNLTKVLTNGYENSRLAGCAENKPNFLSLSVGEQDYFHKSGFVVSPPAPSA